jgi:hypothetical protein
MKSKLISLALIAVLLCMVLGSNICCTPTVQYDLTTSSTAGGNVTDPGEGTYTYDEGEDADLVATPDSGYRFVEWTGGGSDIDDADAATTTITMNADHTVTAHFALGVLIEDVPDTNQPPTATLPTTLDPSNYCAPMAVVNIVYYWDDVMEHNNALNLTQNVTTNFAPETLAEYIGYFMDTNNNGSPARVNNGAFKGTLDVDIAPGTTEFIRWDVANPFLTPPPVLPPGKAGYDWTVTLDNTVGFDFYKAEIDAGRPAVVCFSYWNPITPHVAVVDPETGETIDVYAWGDQIYHSWENGDGNPDEEWYDDIGHAVTGVGYILNWDPDGSGSLPSGNYVIVHDNWSTTPENVAILWANWNSSHKVDPGA